jgi:hypothetical protein
MTYEFFVTCSLTHGLLATLLVAFAPLSVLAASAKAIASLPVGAVATCVW